MRGDLVQETTAFLDEVVWNDEGSVKDIFTAPFSMMNARLADFYGVKGVAGDAFVRADVDTTQRLGLLGQGSLMAALSKIDRTSPVHRAVFRAAPNPLRGAAACPGQSAGARRH
ncbi:MAG: DUF1592 domain-containing protein [Polyangiales bacterium]